MKTFLMPLISILIIVGGLYLLRYSYRLGKETKESLTWPYVNGKILENDLLEIGAGAHPSYDVNLSYEYTVMSKVYQGTRPHLYTITTKKEAEDIVDRFKVGDEISVFYNPKNPESSVLVAGRRGSKPYHEYAMSVVVMLVGVILIFTNLEHFKEAYRLLVK